MVGVTFKGRLGNQLFQFVFFLYLKSRNKNKLVFIPNPHHAYLTKYFDLGQYGWFLGSKIYSVLTRAIPHILKFKQIYVQNFVAPRHIEAEDGTIINGYFQTDWYYRQLSEKPQISLKKQYTDKFDKGFGEIFRNNKTITVHIRRTDYMNYGKRDISLPMEYFKRQLESVKNLSDYTVFFVSDDMQHVRSVFEEKPNYIFSSNDEITDFQLINNADVAIISNSSFAWWACYLSQKDQQVLAPKNWMGFTVGREHPRGVMTDKFEWRDVFPQTA
ncbi:MAG: alpha,2-fucosyltransferase [Sphingobacteriaceae bacterium]|jgi:hypothetical protein|nr:alpha,2-fucosyltransferase [Sphingobacteriaceae bacterium]